MGERPKVGLYWVELDAVPGEAFAVVPETLRARCLGAADPQVGRRRLAAQAALRGVLGALTGRRPDRLALVAGEHGKPALAGGGPHFNLSDTRGLALVAVSPQVPVGVDLEAVRPVRRWRAVMARIFGGEALSWLEAQARPRREAALIAAWCRYEAWAKARGTGLARAGRPPRGLHLPPPEDGRHLPPTPESPAGWWLVDLHPPEGFRAACVTAGGRPPRLVHHSALPLLGRY